MTDYEDWEGLGDLLKKARKAPMSDKPRSSEAVHPLRREHDTDTPSGPDQNMQGSSMSDRETHDLDNRAAWLAIDTWANGARLPRDRTNLAKMIVEIAAAARADERAKIAEWHEQQAANSRAIIRSSVFEVQSAHLGRAAVHAESALYIRALSTPEAKET